MEMFRGAMCRGREFQIDGPEIGENRSHKQVCCTRVDTEGTDKLYLTGTLPSQAIEARVFGLNSDSLTTEPRPC